MELMDFLRAVDLGEPTREGEHHEIKLNDGQINP